MGLTFNMGRYITLLVLIVARYLDVLTFEHRMPERFRQLP